MLGSWFSSIWLAIAGATGFFGGLATVKRRPKSQEVCDTKETEIKKIADGPKIDSSNPEEKSYEKNLQRETKESDIVSKGETTTSDTTHSKEDKTPISKYEENPEEPPQNETPHFRQNLEAKKSAAGALAEIKELMPKKELPSKEISPEAIAKLTTWSKQSKYTVPPHVLENSAKEIGTWLTSLSDQDLIDLFLTVPEKNSNVIENFPKPFAQQCTPKQLALVAGYLEKTGNDIKGAAVGSMLQEIISKLTEAENLGKGGKVVHRESSEKLYAILEAFLEIDSFNPILENQLNAIQKKLPELSLQKGKPSPASLMKKINQKLVSNAKKKAELADLLKDLPAVSDKRGEEIRQFADEIIKLPFDGKKAMSRRAALTKMAKDPQKSEIPYLIDYLGKDSIEKLWAFESVVSHQAHEPSLRLIQMMEALSDDQFEASLSLAEFHKIFERRPKALVGLRFERLQRLADTGLFDNVLYSLHTALIKEKNPLADNEKIKNILQSVLLRVNKDIKSQEAALKKMEKPIDVHLFINSLDATLDPAEIGKTIDKMDHGQLKLFISTIGLDADKLGIFFTIMGKNIFALSDKMKHIRRLERIYPLLTLEQLKLASEMTGFQNLLVNALDHYTEAAASHFDPAQLGIIAKNPRSAEGIMWIIKKISPADETMYHKLLSIAENLPKAADVATEEYVNLLKEIQTAAEKRYVTLPQPPGGFGVDMTKAEGTKLLDTIFKSKMDPKKSKLDGA